MNSLQCTSDSQPLPTCARIQSTNVVGPVNECAQAQTTKFVTSAPTGLNANSTDNASTVQMSATAGNLTCPQGATSNSIPIPLCFSFTPSQVAPNSGVIPRDVVLMGVYLRLFCPIPVVVMDAVAGPSACGEGFNVSCPTGTTRLNDCPSQEAFVLAGWYCYDGYVTGVPDFDNLPELLFKWSVTWM